MDKVKDRLLLIFILSLILVLRITYISNSPYEQGENWRQSDTESIARNFLEDKFNIFYPQFNYDGPLPNYVQLEFQITTFIIAILYKFFGYNYIFARAVPLCFFMGSCIFLYLIGRMFYSKEQAYIVLVIYGILPINIYFSRAIMPESAALFFYLAAYYYFLKWIKEEEKKLIFLSAVFTALSISQKIPTIFIGIPMLIMAIKKYKKAIFKIKELYLFAIIALGSPYLYFKWVAYIAEFRFVNNIAQKHIYKRLFTDIFTKEALNFFKLKLPQEFSLGILLLFIIGIFMIKMKKELPLLLWLLTMILELVLIVAVIRLNYYLIFISPIIALIASKPLYLIWKHKYGGVFITAIVFFIGISSYSRLVPLYKEKTNLLKQANMVKKYTNVEDLIVVGTPDPALINASQRRGWRANIDYYDYIPKDPVKEINYYIENGAKYFVPMKGWIHNDKGEYRKYLEENFKKIIDEDGYYIYVLQ